MGRFTRYAALPDSPSDPRITDLGHPLRPPQSTNAAGQLLDKFENRNIANTTPIQLVANVPTRVLPKNKRRTGLMLQNRDTATPLFVGFGNSADNTSISIPPGGFMLFDFTTPVGEVYLFATLSIQATIVDISRGFGTL